MLAAIEQATAQLAIALAVEPVAVFAQAAGPVSTQPMAEEPASLPISTRSLYFPEQTLDSESTNRPDHLLFAAAEVETVSLLARE